MRCMAVLLVQGLPLLMVRHHGLCMCSLQVCKCKPIGRHTLAKRCHHFVHHAARAGAVPALVSLVLLADSTDVAVVSGVH